MVLNIHVSTIEYITKLDKIFWALTLWLLTPSFCWHVVKLMLLWEMCMWLFYAMYQSAWLNLCKSGNQLILSMEY